MHDFVDALVQMTESVAVRPIRWRLFTEANPEPPFA